MAETRSADAIPAERRERLAVARGEFASLTEAIDRRDYPQSRVHARRLRKLGFSVVPLGSKGND